MKNIEKYPNTRDALEAYDAYCDEKISGVPLEVWLKQDYVAPREPTLLDEAEEFVKNVEGHHVGARLGSEAYANFVELANAVYRERQKPVRNCDRFATAKEAQEAFNKFCSSINCEKCKHDQKPGGSFCWFSWLYAEADVAGKEAE